MMSVINGIMKFVNLTEYDKILEKTVDCVIKINNSILLKKEHMRKIITILNITRIMLMVNSGPAKYLCKNLKVD